MGPFGKLTQHVSYRRAFGLFVNRARDGAPSKKRCCAAGLLTSGFILPKELAPKVDLRATVHHF